MSAHVPSRQNLDEPLLLPPAGRDAQQIFRLCFSVFSEEAPAADSYVQEVAHNDRYEEPAQVNLYFHAFTLEQEMQRLCCSIREVVVKNNFLLLPRWKRITPMTWLLRRRQTEASVLELCMTTRLVGVWELLWWKLPACTVELFQALKRKYQPESLDCLYSLNFRGVSSFMFDACLFRSLLPRKWIQLCHWEICLAQVYFFKTEALAVRFQYQPL